MLNVIEVRPQVNVNDSRLALHNGLCHSVYRLMRCPFRPVAIRPRLEISFEDRLQDKLECPLNHAITDSRNRQNTDFLAPRPLESPSSVPAWADTCLRPVHPVAASENPPLRFPQWLRT